MNRVQIALAGTGDDERPKDLKISAKPPILSPGRAEKFSFGAVRDLNLLNNGIPVSPNISISSYQDAIAPIPRVFFAPFLEGLGKAGLREA